MKGVLKISHWEEVARANLQATRPTAAAKTAWVADLAGRLRSHYDPLFFATASIVPFANRAEIWSPAFTREASFKILPEASNTRA
jgi:hypothetical protein